MESPLQLLVQAVASSCDLPPLGGQPGADFEALADASKQEALRSPLLADVLAVALQTGVQVRNPTA